MWEVVGGWEREGGVFRKGTSCQPKGVGRGGGGGGGVRHTGSPGE